MKNSVKYLVLGTFVFLGLIACGGESNSSNDDTSSNNIEYKSKFVRNGETVIDRLAKLQWQDNSDARLVKKVYILSENCQKYCKDTSGDTAETYCKNLRLGGFTNWRVPTLDELESIIDDSRKPAINRKFQNTSYSTYWTSTVLASNAKCAINFSRGKREYPYNASKQNIRCVRDIL